MLRLLKAVRPPMNAKNPQLRSSSTATTSGGTKDGTEEVKTGSPELGFDEGGFMRDDGDVQILDCGQGQDQQQTTSFVDADNPPPAGSQPTQTYIESSLVVDAIAAAAVSPSSLIPPGTTEPGAGVETTNTASPLKLSDFVIDANAPPLGTGSFGSVHKTTHVPTQTVCVMKIMHKSKGPFQRSYWEREASSLHRLSTAVSAGAANAPQLYGAFEDAESFFLAMELIPGLDMFAFLETQPKFCISEHKARLVIWQVLAVLANAHVVGVAHRDIKLENILVDAQTLRTTVLDFGLAGVAGAWQHDSLTPQHAAALPVMCNDFCGSLDYAAPEVAYKIGPYNAKLADVWSVGIVLFVLVFGITPFSRKQRYRAIRNREAHPPVLWPDISHVSPEIVELIEGMLEVDPRRRLTLQQVVEHPWFVPPSRASAAADDTR